MNTRILELADEARAVIHGTFEKPMNLEELEKFAELILADIDKIIDTMYQTYPLEQAVTLIDLDHIIKEHFYGLRNEA